MARRNDGRAAAIGAVNRQGSENLEGAMFEKGELIMCGGHGVCRVIDITGNPIDRLDQKKKYYVLEPVLRKPAQSIRLSITIRLSCVEL